MSSFQVNSQAGHICHFRSSLAHSWRLTSNSSLRNLWIGNMFRTTYFVNHPPPASNSYKAVLRENSVILMFSELNTFFIVQTEACFNSVYLNLLQPEIPNHGVGTTPCHVRVEYSSPSGSISFSGTTLLF
ncbi:hypothetical protein TNCV_1814841 [Trichonephila clavipes]|nr:hypothetical protein TNCV_1814841 [Trichonephila clavipes]